MDDCAPHEFRPLTWLDWLPFRSSRCLHCRLPRWSHPVHCWMTSRHIGDVKRYSWEDVIKARFRAGKEGGDYLEAQDSDGNRVRIKTPADQPRTASDPPEAQREQEDTDHAD